MNRQALLLSRPASRRLFHCLVALLAFLPAVTGAAERTADAAGVPDLPVAVSSFGAAATGSTLFVFGGHTGRTHRHSFDNLSQLFLAFDLEGGQNGWTALPPGPPLQGTALVSDGDSLYRVGGLRARNPRGQEEDLISVRSAERFDPRADAWVKLPLLSKGRSSHDLALLGDELLVVGGWQMQGKGNESIWTRDVLSLDLAAHARDGKSRWTVRAQTPIALRANTAEVHAGKLWVLGGISAEGQTLDRVDVFDPETGEWTSSTPLPANGRLKGFGADAVSWKDHLYVSQSDGAVYRTTDVGQPWELWAQLDQPRFFHRLVRSGDRLFALGGAGEKEHLATVEQVTPTTEGGDALSWRGFRNGGLGLPEATDPPVDLAKATWAIELPGFGHSSPVVLEDIVYATSVTGDQKETIWISAHSIDDGRELWRTSWKASETMESNDMMARAAPTPAVDSDRLIALFGSGDLLAVDLSGELLWRRNLSADYGSFLGNHGVANSVTLTESAAVVLVARKTYSYLLAVDRETGETLWKADRPAGVSWTTPTLSPEGDEIVVSSNGSVEGYDPVTGKRLWIVDGVTSNTTQSPVVTKDRILVAGSEPKANFALRRGLRGAVEPSGIAWYSESTSNFGSPAPSEHCVYWVNKAGVAQCIDPGTGRSRWKHRLPQSIWATPIVAQGRVYFFGDGGAIQILRDSAEGAEVLASHELELGSQLTAAVAVGRDLLVRAGSRLLAFRR